MNLGPSISLLGVDTPLLSISPIPLVGLIGAALLYLRACSILASRGRVVPGIQRASYLTGLGLILVATQTFVDPVGEQALLSLHMLQHLLIADLPAPLLLYGVRAPVLYFFWPKPVLVTVARMRPVRELWAWLRRPGPLELRGCADSARPRRAPSGPSRPGDRATRRRAR